MDYLTGIIAIICAALVIASPVACTMHETSKVAEMVKAGAHPVAARCAVLGVHAMSTPACMEAARR